LDRKKHPNYLSRNSHHSLNLREFFATLGLSSRFWERIVSISSVEFDSVHGCWLIGALITNAEGRLVPVVVRSCGDESTAIEPRIFDIGGFPAFPERIRALARHPKTLELVIALEFQIQDPMPRKDYGVFRIDTTSGELAPLAPEVEAMGAEITTLAIDWDLRRVLVGTLGRGIIRIDAKSVRPLPVAGELPSDITVIDVDDNTGSLAFGTPRGAYELIDNEPKLLTFCPTGIGPIVTDALPMAVQNDTGRVLLSSYSYGLLELVRDKQGDWQVGRTYRPGDRLPVGNYGEAGYTATREIAAIAHSQGVVHVGDRPAVFVAADELLSQYAMRLLVRREGDIWLAYTPMPFNASPGGIQLLREGRVVRTVAIPNKSLSTIGRWVEVSKRNSVFAATRAGVLEILEDGSIHRRSRYSTTSIAYDEWTGTIGAVGSAIERWNGQQFEPVWFRIDHPRWPSGKFIPGTPIDLAIDRTGIWYLLYNNGLVIVLDLKTDSAVLLDAEDGIPFTARRLLAHPATGEIFVGSASEGIVVIAPSDRR
jgi:hypothetical protein